MEQKDLDLDLDLDTLPSYDDYLVWCSLQGILKPLDESEFEDLLLDIKNEDFGTDRMHGLGFVPVPGGGGMRPRPSINLNSRNHPIPNSPNISGMRGAPDIIAKGMGVWDQINNPDSTTRKAARQATATMRGIKQIFDGLGGNVNVKGGSTIPGVTDRSDRGPTGALLFNIKPNPIEISYSPAIPNTVYADTYRQVRFRDANLYMTSIEYQVPTGDSTVKSYVENVLIPNLELRSNVAVGFNTLPYTNFTYDKITGYIEIVANALLTYFSLTNILTYCKDGGTNTAMWALKDMISAEDALLIDTLGERLTNIPIPPRLKEQMYWLTDINKATNNVPNSPILLITSMNFESALEDAQDNFFFRSMQPKVQFYLDALNPPATDNTVFDKRMMDMMAKVMPGWLKQGIGPGFGKPTHDGHWYDVWMNSPQFSMPDGSGGYSYIPSSTSASQDIEYVTVNDDMSGINQYLFSAYHDNAWSGALKPRPSFIQRQGSVVEFTNRYVFCAGQGVTNIEGALYPYYEVNASGTFGDNSMVVSQSGWFNHVDLSSGAAPTYYRTFPPAVSQAVRGVNIISNQKPSYQSTQWILSFDEAFSGAVKGEGRPKKGVPRMGSLKGKRSKKPKGKSKESKELDE